MAERQRESLSRDATTTTTAAASTTMDDALCLIYLRKLRELVEKYQSEKAIHTHTHRRTYAEPQSLTLTNTFTHTLESYTLNGSLSQTTSGVAAAADIVVVVVVLADDL